MIPLDDNRSLRPNSNRFRLRLSLRHRRMYARSLQAVRKEFSRSLAFARYPPSDLRPWVSTADGVRMKYAFIERVVYIFLLIYLGISYLFALITWHVGSEMLSGCLTKNQTNTSEVNSVLPHVISCTVFAIGTVIVGNMLGEDDLFSVSTNWMMIRSPIDIVVVLTVYFLSNRRKAL